jgi:hypothetical protein
MTIDCLLREALNERMQSQSVTHHSYNCLKCFFYHFELTFKALTLTLLLIQLENTTYYCSMDEGKRSRGDEEDEEQELLEFISTLFDDHSNNTHINVSEQEDLLLFRKKSKFDRHVQKRVVRSSKFGKVSEWCRDPLEEDGQEHHSLRPCTIHHVGGDVLRSILQLVIALSEDTIAMEACKSIALTCKLWFNAINDIRLWWPLFEQKELECIKLIGPKYRMYPESSRNFTFPQRWECLRHIFMKNMLPDGFCGYATVVTTQGKRNNFTNDCKNKRINIREGKFINGQLRVGVEYDLNDEIKEGIFLPDGAIKTGNYEVWEPSVGQWRTFSGEFNPHLGFRDFGTAMWDDGTTYTGEFKQCDRHGIGYMKDTTGGITVAGEWQNDILIIPFTIHDGIEKEIQEIVDDHKKMISRPISKASRRDNRCGSTRMQLRQQQSHMMMVICGLCGVRGHMRTECRFWDHQGKK